ncbi:hypothetical protein CBM2588_A40069 [Cupriavidus taiwanensis]|nr:hypothetical protein CBM2588_A40069 [Cupriavidus taiwanensis]
MLNLLIKGKSNESDHGEQYVFFGLHGTNEPVLPVNYPTRFLTNLNCQLTVRQSNGSLF